MSMLESRAQSPDKDLTDSMAMTKASSAFRAPGRDTKANWANRFHKDFNDLDYDIKYNLVKGKSEFSRAEHYKNKLRNKDRRSSNPSSQGVSMAKYKNRFEMLKASKTINPEQYTINQQKKYSTVETQGLCKFQYEKTIGGRLVHRSDKHLSFQYQTDRFNNVNPVWYSSDQEITFERMLKNLNKNKVMRCHDFSSYGKRRVFEPKDDLDKFYDTQHGLTKATPSTIKQTVRMNLITGRRDSRPKISSTLAYNDEKGRRCLERRSESYEISKGKRQLKFGRQVISAERGCYR